MLLAKVNLFTKLLSYLLPVTLAKTSTPQNPKLALVLNNGHICLNATTAHYSYGKHYPPLRLALEHLKGKLNDVQNLLFLGAGIGSGLLIYEMLAPLPSTDVVDNDIVILNWIQEVLPDDIKHKSNFHHCDAMEFLKKDLSPYQLIISDVFSDCEMPKYISTHDYLLAITNLLSVKGHLIMNYLPNSTQNLDALLIILKQLHLQIEVLQYERNRIIIAKKI